MFREKNILGRLKALRKEKDLRQEHLARRLGIDRTTYVRKERGLIPITTEEWLKLAAVMGEDPCFFFTAPERAPERRERLLLELFRSLDPVELQDVLTVIGLILKRVKRKGVRTSLMRLHQWER